MVRAALEGMLRARMCWDVICHVWMSLSYLLIPSSQSHAVRGARRWDQVDSQVMLSLQCMARCCYSVRAGFDTGCNRSKYTANSQNISSAGELLTASPDILADHFGDMCTLVMYARFCAHDAGSNAHAQFTRAPARCWDKGTADITSCARW